MLILGEGYHVQNYILNVALTNTHFSGTDKRRIINMLIERGADINPRYRDVFSPLKVICSYSSLNCVDFVKLLLDRGAEIDTDAMHMDALQIAYKTQRTDLIKILLDRGKHSIDSNVLATICWDGRIDLVEFFLDWI